MRLFTRLLFSAFLSLALIAPARADAPVRKDAQGDPLPDGAIGRLGTARFRTSSFDSSALLSPDGKLIAVAERGGVIRLLDAIDGAEVRRIDKILLPLTGLHFTPPGDALAGFGMDGSIRFWEVATGRPLGRIDGKQALQRAAAFSADGKVLVVAPQINHQKCVLYAYDVAAAKEIGTYPSIHASDMGVAASADGKTLASWGRADQTPAPSPVQLAEQLKISQTVQLWDVAGGKEARRIETDGGPVAAAAFSPDGKLLALADGKGALQFWDPAKGVLMRTFQGLPSYKTSLAFSRDGKSFLASYFEGTMQAWEAESGKRLAPAAAPFGVLRSLAFTEDGKVLACSQRGQALAVWDVMSGKSRSATGHRAAVGALIFAANGKTLWSADLGAGVLRWDPATWTEMKAPDSVAAPKDAERGFGPRWNSVRLAPEGRRLACCSQMAAVSLRETAPDAEIMAFAGRPGRPVSGCPAAFSPDGSQLAMLDNSFRSKEESYVHIWEADSGRELLKLKGKLEQGTALAISPDGNTLALSCSPPLPPTPFGERTAEVWLWELKSGKGPSSVKQFGAPGLKDPQWLAYSPDGRVTASVEGGGGVWVWDSATGVDLWQAPRAGEVAAPAVFSPDGRLLAVASQAPQSEKGAIRIWEVASGKVRHEFAGRFGPVTSLAFSPDGTVLATGCQDTTILLWDATGARIAEAELKRSLKPDALDALWADLAGSDAAAAGRAVGRLAAAPADAVPFLKKQVRPVKCEPVAVAALAKWADDLNADDFDVREGAERHLLESGAAARTALRKALTGGPSAEVKRRAGELLKKLGRPDLAPDALRLRRAVEALERAGTPEAREWLGELAKGRADADVTEDARAAVKRLAGGAAKAP